MHVMQSLDLLRAGGEGYVLASGSEQHRSVHSSRGNQHGAPETTVTIADAETSILLLHIVVHMLTLPAQGDNGFVSCSIDQSPA